MRFLLGLLIFCQIGLACASKQKFPVADLAREVQRIEHSAERWNAGISFDFSMKHALIEKLQSIGAQRALPEYQRIYRLFDQIVSFHQRLNQSVEVVRFYVRIYVMAVENDEEITAGDYGYSTLVQVYEDLPGWMAKAEENVDEYRELAERFDAEVEKAQIGEVDVNQLKAQVDEAAAAVRQQAYHSLKNIDKVRAKIGPLEMSRRPDLREKLEELEDILGTISEMSFRAQSEALDFHQEVGDNKVFIIAPHMESHRHMLKIQKLMNNIQDLVTQYNSVIQEAWNSSRQARK